MQHRVGGGPATGVFAQVGIDFLLGHAHPVVDLALAHPLQQQLVAQVLAEAVRRQAQAGQAFAQLRHRQAVLPGDVFFRVVDGAVLDLEPDLLGRLQLGLLDDEALQHLARQLLARGQAAALGRLHPGQPCPHVAAGDGFGVDQRDDVLGPAHGAGGGQGRGVGAQRLGLRRAGQGQPQGGGQKRRFIHSVRNGSEG